MSSFNILLTLLVFWKFEIISNVTEVRNSQNAKSPRLTSWRYDVNVSKQTTLLDGVGVGRPKWRVCMGCLIDRVHEAMNPSLI